MASFARGLVGHHGHSGHTALAAALSRSAPLPLSLSTLTASRTAPVSSGSVQQQLGRQSHVTKCSHLFSYTSRCSSRGGARTKRFFSSSPLAFRAQPAKPTSPQMSTPSALSTQRLSNVSSTKSAVAAAATMPGGRGVVRVGGGGISAATMRQTLAEQLGRRTEPTLLYTAPSHFWYRFAGLLTGSFFMVYAVGTAYSVIWDPRPGLAWWVPPAFSLICGIMGGIGIYFVASGRRLVRSIRAVPTAQLEAVAGRRQTAKAMAAAGMRASAAKAAKAAKAVKAPKAAAKAAAPAAASKQAKNSAPAPGTATEKTPGAAVSDEATPIFLEISIGSILPLLPATKVYVPPSKVFLPSRLSQHGLSGGALASSPTAATRAASGTAAAPATPYERVLARRAAEEEQRKARQYEMDHLMTAPFRHLGQGIRAVFLQTQRAMTRDGFMRLGANGYSYRLDVMGGWALENGRALDRLVEIKN